jgi:uncharacterized damage-inducible protein DinB
LAEEMTRVVIASFEAGYNGYKAYAEGAFSQLSDAQLNERPGEIGNSIAMISWHIAGNFASRFSNFLTEDGEKPWRQREEEFALRSVTREELLAKWEGGWRVALDAIGALTDADLARTVHIRQRPLTVSDALLRSLTHASYHVGQIVLLGKLLVGPQWKYLSIPPGQSEAYNRDPKYEKPADFAAHVRGQK